MVHKKYSIALKEALNFTGIKYNTLSQFIGYDLSYVSKWVTGVRLPAAKNVDRINQEIAQFLGTVLQKSNRVKDFAQSILGKEKIDSDDISFEIYQYLSECYRNTLGCKKSLPKEATLRETRVYIGKSACMTFLQQTLKKTLEESNEAPKIVITGEFFDLENNQFWQCLYSISLKSYPCKIYVLLDLSILEKDVVQKTALLFQRLNDLLDYDFTIYEKKSNAYNNLIAINNELVIFYNKDENGEISICTAVTDLKEAHSVYNKCKNFVTSQPILLEPKATLGMEPFGYRDTFYTSERFFFFCVNGFEFLLPDEVFESMLKEAEKGNLKPATVDWVKRVRAIWKDLMTNVSVRFMLPTNSIVRYLETGNIQLTDFSYKLSVDERKMHIQSILKLMRKNPSITLGILLPTTEKYKGNHFINLSFNTNYSTAFLKKNIHYIHENTSLLYYVKSKVLLCALQCFFDSQMQSEHYKEYTVEQLEQLYTKYHFLTEFLIKK